MHAHGSRYTRLFSKRTEIKVKAWIKKYRKWKITDCSKIDIKKRSSFNPRVHTESKKKVAALKKKNDTKSGGNLHRNSDKKYVPHAEEEDAMAKAYPNLSLTMTHCLSLCLISTMTKTPIAGHRE